MTPAHLATLDAAAVALDLNVNAQLASEVREIAAAYAAPTEASNAADWSLWAEYVAGMVVAFLGGGVDDERIKPIAGIIERRLPLLPGAQRGGV